LEFAFYAGKGGVGKTTCASAFALSAHRRRVLLVSTDPAHSLGDVLGVRLASTPRAVTRSVDAVELDAPRAFARWLAGNRRPLGDIIEHGTWLDRDDIDALLDLSIPGIDELMGLLEIARLADRGRRDYDLIVVDTAPTGHTLRLLAAPRTVAAVAGVLDGLQDDHRIVRDQLARVGRAEASDRLIALLADQARETKLLLQDPARTTFHWVTLAEDLSIAESADGIAALEADGMRVSAVIVNRVLPDVGPCPLCDRRRAEERRAIAALRRRLGRGRSVSLVVASAREPRGLKALASLAPVAPARATRAASGRREGPAVVAHSSQARAAAANAFGGASLLFFGGKGGVGKTTVSAAVALRLAEADRDRRVLLLSTDAAHSLGDVFGEEVGDAGRPIRGGPPNLEVRELDAARALASRRTQFEEALDEITTTFGAGAASASGAGASELMKLAPPGIDELFGVLSVVDARATFDVIVVDTAPTGHALRLLELPDAAREWIQALLRVLLKYKSLVRPGQLAGELVRLSKSIRELQALLRDHARARFVVVTRAAQVPRAETGRLLRRLRRLRLSASTVVVNAMTLAPGRCRWCRGVSATERRELTALRRLCRGRCVMIQTPLVAPPPRGVTSLNEWAHLWLADSVARVPVPR
jgi:arsenite/tail-anchored protein-transporting ATPase